MAIGGCGLSSGGDDPFGPTTPNEVAVETPTEDETPPPEEVAEPAAPETPPAESTVIELGYLYTVDTSTGALVSPATGVSTTTTRDGEFLGGSVGSVTAETIEAFQQAVRDQVDDDFVVDAEDPRFTALFAAASEASASRSLEHVSYGVWARPRGEEAAQVLFAYAGEWATDLPTAGYAIYEGDAVGAVYRPRGGSGEVLGRVDARIDFSGDRLLTVDISDTSYVDFDTGRRVADPGLSVSAGGIAIGGDSGRFVAAAQTVDGAFVGAIDGGFYGPTGENIAGVVQMTATGGGLYGLSYGGERTRLSPRAAD